MFEVIICLIALIAPILFEFFLFVIIRASLSYDLIELKNQQLRGIYSEREFKWQIFWTHVYHVSFFIITFCGNAIILFTVI